MSRGYPTGHWITPDGAVVDPGRTLVKEYMFGCIVGRTLVRQHANGCVVGRSLIRKVSVEYGQDVW